jgi:hypothetical protein
MRNVVDPNQCLEHVQDVPPASDVLKQNGEETLMFRHTPDGDSRAEPILRPIGRRPMQAILEGLDLWQDQASEFRPDTPDQT